MAALQSQPIGQSEIFHQLMDSVSDMAALERPVLIVGEHGTGKELIASRLHFLSPRWEQILVKVNCAAFDEDMLNIELFGETFLDGRDDTNGRFYQADGGTLFLDNIDQVSPRLQEKLMRAVEYGEFEAGVESETQSVDVRLIVATGVDLPGAVAAGTFRVDLLDRLAFHVLTLPPLRVRPDDIPALAEHFGRKISGELGADAFPGFTAEVSAALLAQSWPGNVRELKLVVERSVAKAFLADESLSAPIASLVLDPFDSPYRLQSAPKTSAPIYKEMIAPVVVDGKDTPDTVETPTGKDFAARVMTFERSLIDEAMTVAEHHQGKAADYLGMTYHAFRGLLRKHGLKK